ncbi:MAG: hypothetical protein LC655_00185 [Bacteroidales bacterium]|nr:hypothetical protein [Bacteroidales bacterium]
MNRYGTFSPEPEQHLFRYKHILNILSGTGINIIFVLSISGTISSEQQYHHLPATDNRSDQAFSSLQTFISPPVDFSPNAIFFLNMHSTNRKTS